VLELCAFATVTPPSNASAAPMAINFFIVFLLLSRCPDRTFVIERAAARLELARLIPHRSVEQPCSTGPVPGACSGKRLSRT
jgi:hypothetical protein